MTIKTLKTAACAGALMSAVAWSGGAFAAGTAGDSYSFESEVGAGITGDTSLVAVSPSVPSYPLPTVETTHLQVLEVAGTVAYTNGTISANANDASQVDLLFKVEPTDEALESISDSSVQVALAVSTNVVDSGTTSIMLWCKENSTAAAGWAEVKTGVTTGSWIRATLVLDYDAQTCKVSFNGDFAAEKTLAGGTANQNYVKSITMVGSTQIDDLVVKYESLKDYNPYKNSDGTDMTVAAGETGVNVTYKYLNDYDVTVAQAESDAVLNEVNMPISEKFAAGLNPRSPTKFKMETMTTSAGSATITFPGNNSYTLKVGTTKGGNDVGTADSTPTEATTGYSENVNTATVSIPAADQDKLLYFTVETK